MIAPLLIGALVIGGVALILSQDDEKDTPPPAPPRRAPPPRTTTTAPPIPPVQTELPGGTYIDGVGWCPPFYQYDAASGLCRPMVIRSFPFPVAIATAGAKTGACCDSCGHGGPCMGCD